METLESIRKEYNEITSKMRELKEKAVKELKKYMREHNSENICDITGWVRYSEGDNFEMPDGKYLHLENWTFTTYDVDGLLWSGILDHIYISNDKLIIDLLDQEDYSEGYNKEEFDLTIDDIMELYNYIEAFVYLKENGYIKDLTEVPSEDEDEIEDDE